MPIQASTECDEPPRQGRWGGVLLASVDNVVAIFRNVADVCSDNNIQLTTTVYKLNTTQKLPLFDRGFVRSRVFLSGFFFSIPTVWKIAVKSTANTYAWWKVLIMSWFATVWDGELSSWTNREIGFGWTFSCSYVSCFAPSAQGNGIDLFKLGQHFKEIFRNSKGAKSIVSRTFWNSKGTFSIFRDFQENTTFIWTVANESGI